jgi:hypothetical protein
MTYSCRKVLRIRMNQYKVKEVINKLSVETVSPAMSRSRTICSVSSRLKISVLTVCVLWSNDDGAARADLAARANIPVGLIGEQAECCSGMSR